MSKSDVTRCGRALRSTRTGYKYCGKPATHVVTPPAETGFGQYGLCGEHLAEMRGKNMLRRSVVRPLDGKDGAS